MVGQWWPNDKPSGGQVLVNWGPIKVEQLGKGKFMQGKSMQSICRQK